LLDIRISEFKTLTSMLVATQPIDASAHTNYLISIFKERG